MQVLAKLSSRDCDDISSRSGLVVKFVLAMHEPRVRFTAATVLLFFFGSSSIVLLAKMTLFVSFVRRLKWRVKFGDTFAQTVKKPW